MASVKKHATVKKSKSADPLAIHVHTDSDAPCYHKKEEYILGSIKFLHLDSSDMGFKDRNFIIINAENDTCQTFEYLTRKWNLGAPKLVISLIGGYREITQGTSVVKKTFRRQLVNAVLSTGAWLTTGGLHSGMTKDVGEALREYAIGRAMAQYRRIVALGIVPLSVLKHNQKLSKAGQIPVKYKIDPSDVTNAQLDPNHTHFIIVDDEGSANAGAEMDVQGKLLREITGRMIEGCTAGVPVVCIVIGGGYKRIKAVHQAVMSNIPVIILEHTGGAADVLAFACANMNNSANGRIGLSSTLSRKMFKTTTRFMTLLRTEFGMEKIKMAQGEIAQYCREIADQSNLVTVVSFNDLHGANVVEDTILNALLKAKSGQHYSDQLHLAAVLNRFDLAQKLLEDITCVKVPEVRQTIRFALVNDQVNLVRLLLNKGLSLYEYLTVRELTSLYKMINKDTLLHALLDCEVEKRGRTPVHRWLNLKDVGNVLRKLTPSSYRPLYLRDEIADRSDRFPDPWRELFLWAILQCRLEIAQLFWREGKASIGGALVASKLLKELSLKAPQLHESKLVTQYKEGGILFEQLAVGVLDECYHSDRKRTSLIIVRRLEKWGCSNYLDLANSASNLKFIAHAAVQNVLTEFWMGNLSLSNPRWKVWACLVFPPALLFIHLKLKEEELDPLFVKSLPRGTADGTILIRKSLVPSSGSRKATGGAVFSPGKSRKWGISFPLRVLSRDVETDDSTGPSNRGASQRRVSTYDEKDDTRQHVSIFRRIKSFFLAPRVIFAYNVVALVTFIGIFSYILLAFNYDETHQIQPIEYVLLVWFGSLCTEYIRQIHHEEATTMVKRLKSWICQFWNIVDISKGIVFIIGFVLRCSHDHHIRSYGQIILCLALISFYMRILHIFSASKHLGPKLIMMQRMFADLLVFIGVLFVFLIAYGVASEAILNPGRTDYDLIIKSIFYRPYIQMFGEMLEIEYSDCGDHCEMNERFGTVLLAIYLFLSNVLLLNLLIAMFNYTFNTVQENTDVYWKYQRYKLIREYYKRPALAPPFIIISHMYIFIVFCIKCLFLACKECRKSRYCTCCRTKATFDPGLPSLTQASINEMTIWESVKGEDYLSKEQEKEKRDVNNILKNSEDRMLQLTDHVTMIMEDMRLVHEQMENMQALLIEKLGPSEILQAPEDVDPAMKLAAVALLARSKVGKRVSAPHVATR